MTIPRNIATAEIIIPANNIIAEFDVAAAILFSFADTASGASDPIATAVAIFVDAIDYCCCCRSWLLLSLLMPV